MPRSEELFAKYLGLLPQSEESPILELLIDVGLRALDADEGSLLVVDADGKSLRFAMTASRQGRKGTSGALIGQTVPIGKGLTGLAAQTLQVHVGAPVYRTANQSIRVKGTEHDPEAVIAAPMLSAGALVGVLTAVSFRKGKRFTTDDSRLYGGLAAIAGVVVGQRRQLNRLAEKRGREDVAALSVAARAERSVLERTARLAGRDPEFLSRLDDLLASIESLAGGRKARSR